MGVGPMKLSVACFNEIEVVLSVDVIDVRENSQVFEHSLEVMSAEVLKNALQTRRKFVLGEFKKGAVAKLLAVTQAKPIPKEQVKRLFPLLFCRKGGVEFRKMS
jgi:hypothetical protein